MPAPAATMTSYQDSKHKHADGHVSHTNYGRRLLRFPRRKTSRQQICISTSRRFEVPSAPPWLPRRPQLLQRQQASTTLPAASSKTLFACLLAPPSPPLQIAETLFLSLPAQTSWYTPSRSARATSPKMALYISPRPQKASPLSPPLPFLPVLRPVR